jgi:phosphate transport system substrate-binding protein
MGTSSVPRRFVALTVVLAIATAACSDDDPGNPTSTDPTVPLAELIASDPPVVDGSTSTQPLRMLLVCRLLGVDCDWMDTGLSDHRIIVPNEDSPLAGQVFDLVPTSGTHGSYLSLISGESDLIVVARSPSDDEISSADAAGIEFDIHPIALDAFVFLVNEEGPVTNLSLDQIRRIYTGEITDWDELGGPVAPINPYRRNETSGSEELMKRLVMGDAPMVEAPDWLLGFSMIAPFTSLSHDPIGIGYSVYYYAAFMQPLETVSMIGVDGVVPSSESIRTGMYPLVTEVYAVIRTGEEGSPRAMFDWLVTSDGQDAIAATGYIKLP